MISMFQFTEESVQRPLELDIPTDIVLSNNETVTVTPLNANHCIGAVMYVHVCAAFLTVPLTNKCQVPY